MASLASAKISQLEKVRGRWVRLQKGFTARVRAEKTKTRRKDKKDKIGEVAKKGLQPSPEYMQACKDNPVNC